MSCLTAPTPLDPEDIAQGGTNVPVVRCQDVSSYSPSSAAGALRYEVPLSGDIDLESLVLNKGSDVLVVVFHGAMTSEKHYLPRFEWLRTFANSSYSSLYFSDPSLRRDPDLQLGWYIGWDEVDLFPLLGDLIIQTAEAIGADKVILVGSSGGGFASLQAATYVPGSLAIPFNPQTEITKYLVSGSKKVQKKFIELVMPELAPQGVDKLLTGADWFAPLGSRASAIKRYKDAQSNRVLYAQNMNDFHHYSDHYLPFMKNAQKSPNFPNIREVIYEGKEGHKVPDARLFHEVINEGIRWLAEDSSESSSQGSGTSRQFDEDTNEDMGILRNVDLAELVYETRRHHAQAAKQIAELKESVSRLNKRLSRIPLETANWISPLGELAKMTSQPVPSQALTSFTLRPQDILQLVHHIYRERPSLIVECGSGMSSVWMGHALQNSGGGRLISLEHDAQYWEQSRELVERNGLSHIVEVRLASLDPFTIEHQNYPWYNRDEIDDLENIDILLVDGPPAATGPQARYPALVALADRLRKGAVVMLDDAERSDEQSVLDHWRESYWLEDIALGAPSRDQRGAVFRYFGRTEE